MNLKKYILFLVLLTFGCSNEKDQMNVNISIDGFKKGKIYLQKIKDSILINVDSVFIENKSQIMLTSKIDSPEFFYINLDVSKNENKIGFFGEKGDISIFTNLKKFNSEFNISGSSNDSIYREYTGIIKKFNNNRLDLIKLSFDNVKNKDSATIIQKEIESLNKRQYLFSLNFAVTNGSSHVAPYIALSEFPESSKVLLDTIKNSLSIAVLNSKYGQMLQDLIKSK
jgi:hypothetical protein|tara:strand:- start:4107 stop:4784 length:678 start_codon:yes stop_codon:yes gene_type:complete